MKNIVLIPYRIDELKDIIRGVFNESLENHFKKEKEEEKLLTRSEVMDYLKVGSTTLNNYVNSGHIKQYGIKGKPLFKKSEIEQSLIKKIV